MKAKEEAMYTTIKVTATESPLTEESLTTMKVKEYDSPITTFILEVKDYPIVIFGRTQVNVTFELEGVYWSADSDISLHWPTPQSFLLRKDGSRLDSDDVHISTYHATCREIQRIKATSQFLTTALNVVTDLIQ